MALNELIENLYTNNYLLKLNDRWQPIIDATSTWNVAPLILQRHFFSHAVQPFLTRKAKVCVIISDALRYEVGEELLSRIRQEDRYRGEGRASGRCAEQIPASRRGAFPGLRLKRIQLLDEVPAPLVPLRVHGLPPGFSNSASNAWPFSVSRYFWRRLVGFSGLVMARRSP